MQELELNTAGAIVPDQSIAATGSQRLAPHQPSDDSVRQQLIMRDILREGEEAIERIAKNEAWDDWCAVMLAFDAGRSYAMREAGTNRTDTPAYRKAYRKWLERHPAFKRIHKSDRSKILKCFDHLDEINDWRCKRVPPHKLLKLNYPPTVLAHWDRWKKKQAASSDADHEKEDAGEEQVGLLAAWRLACASERAEILPEVLTTVSLPELLAAMREGMRRSLYERALGIAYSRCDTPKARAVIRKLRKKMPSTIEGTAKKRSC
jgi:hypothetical protein